MSLSVRSPLKCYVLAIFWVLCCPPALAAQEGIADAAEAFCRAEFNGEEGARLESMGLVAFSKAQQAINKKKDPQFSGQVNFLDADPLIVVSGYRILDTSAKGRKASARIEFQQLATTTGYGFYKDSARDRTFHLDRKSEVVELHLVHDKQWKVIDPPLPRVSLTALLHYYRLSTERHKEIAHLPGITDFQRAAFSHDLATYTFLRSLASPDSSE